MDQQEFARRVHGEQTRFYRIAYSYVKNEPDALDIVGESVYKGLRQLKTLKEESCFQTWFTRIVINCALDMLRRSSGVTYLDDGLAPNGPVPDEAALTPEDSLDLYRALDILGQRERTGVTLRYFEGYGYRQTAEILQEPVSTVKARIAGMFGEQVEPSAMYDADGKVICVNIYLAGAEAEPYATQLTELYGEPGASSAGDASESGSSWQSWDTGDGTIKLFQSFGLCSPELTREPPDEA